VRKFDIEGVGGNDRTVPLLSNTRRNDKETKLLMGSLTLKKRNVNQQWKKKVGPYRQNAGTTLAITEKHPKSEQNLKETKQRPPDPKTDPKGET